VLQTGAQRVQHRTFAAHAERQHQLKLPIITAELAIADVAVATGRTFG
jgi:hypothetical protein